MKPHTSMETAIVKLTPEERLQEQIRAELNAKRRARGNKKPKGMPEEAWKKIQAKRRREQSREPKEDNTGVAPVPSSDRAFQMPLHAHEKADSRECDGETASPQTEEQGTVWRRYNRRVG